MSEIAGGYVHLRIVFWETTSEKQSELILRSTKRSNKEMEERIRVYEKKVEAQRFVMTNLRNGIDYLKDQGPNSIGKHL